MYEDGVEAASVRRIADELNISVGKLRHYFITQQGLLGFALDAITERVSARIKQHRLSARSGDAAAIEILGELLPLDHERSVEVSIWLSFLSKARHDKSLDELKHRAWKGERYVCRMAIVATAGWSYEGRNFNEPFHNAEVEKLADELHLFIAGLTIQSGTYPDKFTPQVINIYLRDHTVRLNKELGDYA